HGNLTGAGQIYTDPYSGFRGAAGGAAVLARYLLDRKRANPDTTLLVHSGDMIGASPPESGLLQDEPTVRVLNQIGFDVGTPGNHEFDEGLEELLRPPNAGPPRGPPRGPPVRVLNQSGFDARTPGNHEFDEGLEELLRLLNGGPSQFPPGSTFEGQDFPLVSANIVDADTKEPIFDPYLIKRIK